MMCDENIFMISGNVSGESMIGYERYMKKLERYAFCAGKSLGVSLTGMHQVGKTSLVKEVCSKAPKDEYVTIYINLCEIVADENSRMLELIKQIAAKFKRALRKKSVEDEFIDEDIERIEKAVEDTNSLRSDFKNLFKDAGSFYHTILVIDEFDSAKNFSDADYELLRTIMTDGEYNTSLFMVSRRQLQHIVPDNYNNSKLVNSAKKEYVKGFNGDDIEKFYGILEEKYNICLTDEEKEKLMFYAGIIPVLYSRIGYEMVEKKLAGEVIDIDNICKNMANDFFEYFQTIYDRLKTDNYIEDVYAAVIGPVIGVGEIRINALEAIGYLYKDDDGGYVAFAPYFALYLRTQNISVSSEWEKVIEVEKLIKSVVEEQIKRFGIEAADKEMYEKFLTAAYAKRGSVYSSLSYDNYMTATKRNFNIDVTLLDVMSFKNTIFAYVEPLWNDCFAQYFGNEPYRNWAERFLQCYRARDPLAHGHGQFLSKAECDVVSAYCDMITEKVKSCRMDADISKLKLPEWLNQENAEEVIDDGMSEYIGKQYTFRVEEVSTRGTIQGLIVQDNTPASIKKEFNNQLTDEQKQPGAEFDVIAVEVAPQKNRLLTQPV